MILYFLDSQNNEKELYRSKDKKKIFDKINQYLSEHNFKSYYTRMNFLSDSEIILDFGSHIEFFVIKTEKDENINLINLFMSN